MPIRNSLWEEGLVSAYHFRWQSPSQRRKHGRVTEGLLLQEEDHMVAGTLGRPYSHDTNQGSEWRCPVPLLPHAHGSPLSHGLQSSSRLVSTTTTTSSNNPLPVMLVTYCHFFSGSVHHSRAISSPNFLLFSSGSTSANLLDTYNSLPQSTGILPHLNDEAGWRAVVYLSPQYLSQP